jgi:lipopolysaccharide export system protein LptA
VKIVKTLLVTAVLVFIAAIFYWALFTPKPDFTQRIYQTIKEQENRADLAFKKVVFEEVVAGEKFWQIQSETAVVNKNSGLATLQKSNGTFYKKGKAVLKFRSPAALWDMKKKEIYLDQPLGYDAIYERQILNLVRTLKAQPLSVFNLAKKYKQGPGYWFQAKNLAWKVADQQLFCKGGIVLNKGEVTGYSETLRGDVEFRKVLLEGNPRLVVSNDNREAVIVAGSMLYLQNKNKLELAGHVKVTYRDITGWGDAAGYLIGEQRIVLTGNAGAAQGENKLNGDRIMVSLRDQKISLLGKGKVVIREEDLIK